MPETPLISYRDLSLAEYCFCYLLILILPFSEAEYRTSPQCSSKISWSTEDRTALLQSELYQSQIIEHEEYELYYINIRLSRNPQRRSLAFQLLF